LPTGLYILLALIFFYFIPYLMISRRTIISGSAGPIFAIFLPNERVLGADERSRRLFFDILRDVAMATNFVKKMANFPHSSLWHSKTEWDISEGRIR